MDSENVQTGDNSESACAEQACDVILAPQYAKALKDTPLWSLFLHKKLIIYPLFQCSEACNRSDILARKWLLRSLAHIRCAVVVMRLKTCGVFC